MNYHLNRAGQDLGIFPLEELRRRRQTGELDGTEWAWCEGMSEWQALDALLESSRPSSALPPPIPRSARKKGPPAFVIVIVVVAAILLVVQIGWVARKTLTTMQQMESANGGHSDRQAVALASRPVVWNTNTLTEADVRKADRAFRVREYLEAYQAHGPHTAPWDTEARQLIQSWIASNYGGAAATNLPGPAELGDKLAANTDCDDPIVLTVAGVTCIEQHAAVRRLERALKAFPHSPYRAYPQFYATVTLARLLSNHRGRVGSLDESAVRLLRRAFSDGSFQPADQARIADILVNGWGYYFFKRNAAAVCRLPQNAGKGYQWLSLVLEGERQVIEAWRARGGGYANTVNEAGWRGFRTHLASARKEFTRAWHLRPDLPLAPSRMIYVSLGDSGLAEMRRWFDRTLLAQIDYPRAWSDMRWGLRPRWYGSLHAMLALGVTAVNTHRFDTDVPRKLFDLVSDMESEEKLPLGQHLYGRPEIWPHLKEMYEGYIASPSVSAHTRAGWRSAYTVVAYLAGKYGVARQQLVKLNWHPWPSSLTGWGTDLSLLPDEVAARTGPLGKEIAEAESSCATNGINQALWRYSLLMASTNADERTAKFIRCRLASLQLEQRLDTGDWVDFLPHSLPDPAWKVAWGQARVLGDGALEVQSGPPGHLLYCRTPVGTNFEVKGEFDLVRTSDNQFQAGVVMGMPDCDRRLNSYNWYAFRMKKNTNEGQIASFSTAWTRQQISRSVKLNRGTNTFDLRFLNDRVTARVNGKEVFRRAAPRRRIRINPREFLLGVGAFNDMNTTVIRYQHLEVRRLSVQTSQEQTQAKVR